MAILLAATCALLVQWFWIERASLLLAATLVMSLQVASIAHNHNHLPMWRSRALNVLQDYLLTFLYGLPKVSWVAIHNASHHTHGNRPGLDCTSTHNVGDRNDLLGLLAYAPASTAGFWREHGRVLATLWRRDRRRFAYQASHIAFLWGTLALALVVDWRKALLFVILPQQVGIASITTFNFCQHAHADPASRHDVARNFSSPILNAYLFNVGHHTIHHEKPTLHWSLIPAAQARLAHLVDPRLRETSFWRYFFGTVVLGTFARRRRSMPVYAARPS